MAISVKIKQIIRVSTATFLCVLMAGCGGQDASCHQNTEYTDAELQEQSEGNPADAEAKNAEADEAQEAEPAGVALADGVYTADFDTDGFMFRVSEACDGKGTLTVQDGAMTIHVSLNSKKIVNLYEGTAEEAMQEGASLLQPTTDEVTYSDGLTEEVYGFDIPVPVLDEEFDLALIGTKGTWYDHKVIVSNPEPLVSGTEDEVQTALPDGSYTIELTMEGGSGKAQITSPAQITVQDGAVTARLEWSSPYYDYMVVGGEKYLPVNTEGNSVFEIPVGVLDEPIEVLANTVAMSTPHEVEYTLLFHSDSAESAQF